MSTSASQLTLSPEWKQEVNQRVAAHRNRRCSPAKERKAAGQKTSQDTSQEPRHGTSDWAAQVAARVAARYAAAPSYNEARTAIRAAEIATEAAMEARAKAQALLEGLKREAERKPRSVDGTAARLTAAPEFSSPGAPRHAHPEARPEPAADLPFVAAALPEATPVRTAPVYTERARRTPAAAPVWRGAAAELLWEELPESGKQAAKEMVQAQIQPEAAVPVPAAHAKLIEFPQEPASHRSGRARGDSVAPAKGQDATGQDGQLSIFEVDPSELSIPALSLPALSLPEVKPGFEEARAVEAAVAEVAVTEAPARSPEPVRSQAPTLSVPVSQWSEIELAEHPRNEAVHAEVLPVKKLEQAPLGHRLLSGTVDAALITGALAFAGMVAVANSDQLPSARLLTIGAVAGWLAIAFFYHGLFFWLGDATPGMKYARISLTTFDDEFPSRARRRWRLGALVLSVLPLGLGLAWAIFDEDHLCWHDRLSRTYQRKCF